MSSSAISTDRLLITYPLSGRHYSLGQLAGMTILDQAFLDAAAIDTELAILIKFYQSQMNMSSVNYSNLVLSRFIKLISNSVNYSNLVLAYIDLESPKIPISLQNEEVKRSLLTLTQALIDSTTDITFSIQLLKNELELIQITFAEIQEKYNLTLAALLKKSGAKASEIALKIEEKNKEITDNINAIVEGGVDLAQGLNDLGNGALTTIANIPSEKKEKKEKAMLAVKDNKPDPNYVIKSIVLSAQGIAKGSTATKALAANNKELADLYQDMSAVEAIFSVATATKVQNDLFIDIFNKCSNDAVLLETNWTGVTQSCEQLKSAISALKTEEEAAQLQKSLNASSKEWIELKNQLNILKLAFTGS